ncbi:MAG: YggS family pyridoxal phosphate-dependent enzyme [Calditrichaeota bacterium]|nr:MAG: YggS family pyridoxal phosphate-dependent enzyme [Calditrichota bacterium]
MLIKENIEKVKEIISRACARVGRNPEEVLVVAVTKNVEVPRILEAIEAGIQVIGENRVQEALPKYQIIGNQVSWHMIGHLQTNKVKKALQFADMIQSVDSLHLAHELQKQAEKVNRDVDILIEVNTSGEPTKFGFKPEETLSAIEEISRYPRLHIKGLMTIGAFLPDPEQVRPCFVLLRQLKEQLVQKNLPAVEMKYLSMGMTDDFEVAIEEGSNMVRIGRAIFGERPVH